MACEQFKVSKFDDFSILVHTLTNDYKPFTLIPNESNLMIKYILENSDIHALVKLGPQNLLKVINFKDLLAMASSLRLNSKNDERWISALTQVRPIAALAGIELIDSMRIPIKGLNQQQGDQVLTFYFSQILRSKVWILDYRSNSWQLLPDNGFAWNPRRIFYEPSELFLQGIQKLYGGFYENKPSLFQEGLQILGLEAAAKALQAHFGTGDKRHVQFSLSVLQRTFVQVFDDCAQANAKIHPEFSVFGIGLLALYQSLEESKLCFDVRSAFERAST